MGMLSKHSNKLFLGCARLLLGGRLAVPHWPRLYTQFFWNSHCDAAVVCHRGLTRVGEFPDSCKLGLGTNSGPGKILKLRGYVSFFPNWWARSGRARFRLARLDLDFAMRWSHLMVWVREFYRARYSCPNRDTGTQFLEVCSRLLKVGHPSLRAILG
ncbi:uncharacterized protein [Physcomitrium patens]|uniref:uncharacterized protein isoform X2 n=1 Tax=Physcomitrium patens TaxID=3218 RepID=UPI000D174C70|nr:uncharacterized protein LOC112273465 [Physcomitrium patens]|eukprot:XP_024358067.1 uncharacterized protein LOC112273465 [Physcomitrella patens]